MGNTTFLRAKDVIQAVSFLKEYGSSAVLLAGGTDIMVQQNQYKLPEDTVFIGIEDIPEMKLIEARDDGIHIGSMVTDAELIASDLVKENLYALYLAAKESASPQVRNRATIGGNVGTASPSGDLLTALVALNAVAVVAGAEGEKRIPVEKIPVFVKKTCLEATDIIREFIVPRPEKNEGSCFIKMGKRKAMTISIVSAAAKIRLSDDGTAFANAVIAAGAVAPTVVRLTHLEEAIIGQPATEETIAQNAEKSLLDVSPITDLRATEWYRKEIVQVFSRRVLEGALKAIKEG